MKKQEFNLTFQITKKITFQVSYYTLGNNNNPYFATSANVFNQPKTDFKQCGQCQKDVLFGKALKFFYKWNKLHLNDLTVEQYQELIIDIEVLKECYNWIDSQSFYSQKELSMMKLKIVK